MDKIKKYPGLQYIDPEAYYEHEHVLQVVSGHQAGRAFNDICKMIGGRWPDAKMEVEAPEAYTFFQELLTGDLNNKNNKLNGSKKQEVATPQIREALENLIKYVERNTCTHENTHRGGVVWTICDDCGKMWADDHPLGFTGYREPPELTAAYEALK